MSSFIARLVPLVSLGSAKPIDDGDRALVRRARAGDPHAFRALYERHGRPVWRFARDSLQDHAEADEVSQETFVRAHAALSRLRDDDRVLPWLLGIARRVCLERFRCRGPEPVGTAEESEACSALPLPSAPTPEQLLLDGEIGERLEAALATLREARRTALLLRIEHGLGYPEIATIMGWSLPKVKNEIHRARLQLRVLLSDHVGVSS